MKKSLQGLLLAVFYLIVILATLEFGARWIFRSSTDFGSVNRMTKDWFYKYSADTYRPSKELAYEPIYENNELYNADGFLKNTYSKSKTESDYRFLVLGDSVTRRRAYVDYLSNHLNERFPDRHFQFLNAAVEGYNAKQYSELLKKRAPNADPDFVLTGFHMNDFGGTPAVYLHKGRYVVFSPGASIYKTRLFNGWLYSSSAFYRLVLMTIEKHWFKDVNYTQEFFDKAKNALLDIKQYVSVNNMDQLVVLLPLIKSYDRYSPEEIFNYQEMIQLLKKENIPHLDLIKALVIDGNVDDLRSKSADSFSGGPNDTWHPSYHGHEIIGRHIYDYLYDHDFMGLKNTERAYGWDSGEWEKGVTAEYFPNKDWKGPSIKKEQVPHINAFWPQDRKPVPPPFSVKYTGQVYVPEPGRLELRLSSDDGSTLSWAGENLIDHLGLHGMTSKSGIVTVKKGWYDFTVRVFDIGGMGGAKLEWVLPSGAQQLPPPRYFRSRRAPDKASTATATAD